ncbi:ABC transporter substrate-binding protein [Williamsia sp.]|uniref:ABC transporter substrate-binding protein n=1 Tax=Williamsia sp. TaxID=1872085 RepID=UPI002F95AA51
MSTSPLSAPISRRSLFRAGLGVGATALVGIPILAACGSDSAASDDGTVSAQTGWVPTVEQAGTYVAATNGYFTSRGINVDILAGGPNTAVDTVVVSGKAALGNGNADAVAEMITNGADVKVIGSRFQRSPFCVYSLSDKAVTDPTQMVGKKIGVAAQNEAPFRVLCAINNVDVDDLTIVPVQFDPAPTANGEVDAQVGFLIDQPATLRAQGLDVNTILFSDFGYNVFSSVWFATTETIETRPDMLVSFLGGERQGWQENLKDPALGARLAVDVYGKNTGLDLAQQTLASQSIESLMVTPEVPAADILTMTDAQISSNIATLKSVGLDISAEQLFDTSILAQL